MSNKHKGTLRPIHHDKVNDRRVCYIQHHKWQAQEYSPIRENGITQKSNTRDPWLPLARPTDLGEARRQAFGMYAYV